MTTSVSVTIRMYRLNELGDCFLLTFVADDAKSHMLIDCGSFRNSGPSIKRLRQITKQIRKTLGGDSLDVVVGTHQHNDHVSGFVHCEDDFQAIGVKQVWLSWLDDPSDRKARAIGRDHNNLKLQLAAARDGIRSAVNLRRTSDPIPARSVDILNDILGFYGASAAGTPPELPQKGIEILKNLGVAKPLYLRPGRTVNMPGLPSDSVRVHVLGPPRNDELLYRKDPRTGESYDHSLSARLLLASKFVDAAHKHQGSGSTEEAEYPFSQQSKHNDASGSPALNEIRRRYNRQREQWRTIDNDWLQQAETLALFLDTYTNNSSLALAIELVKSKKVLLFAADAQTGNWLSWKDVKWEVDDLSTDDLLARTVFYKVGHHASHNATLVEAFEKMTSPDLVALIPVHKKDPNITKKKGWKMPARNLFKKLVERTDHRVLQMDGVNPANCNPSANPAKAAWKRVGVQPRISADAIEVEIAG